MDVVPGPFTHADRAGGTNADARPASAAGVLVQFWKKGTANAWPEVYRLLGTGVEAGLAGDAGLRKAGRRYGDRMRESSRRVCAEHGLRAGLRAFTAKGAFSDGEIESRKGVNERNNACRASFDAGCAARACIKTMVRHAWRPDAQGRNGAALQKIAAAQIAGVVHRRPSMQAVGRSRRAEDNLPHPDEETVSADRANCCNRPNAKS